jgi:hypothetical protein
MLDKYSTTVPHHRPNSMFNEPLFFLDHSVICRRKHS